MVASAQSLSSGSNGMYQHTLLHDEKDTQLILCMNLLFFLGWGHEGEDHNAPALLYFIGSKEP